VEREGLLLVKARRAFTSSEAVPLKPWMELSLLQRLVDLEASAGLVSSRRIFSSSREPRKMRHWE